jgi:hypothetical protein
MSDDPESPKYSKKLVEASWAPQDPRDKLYDADASSGEKIASFTRIVGSFHPILNLFIIGFDIVRRGWRYLPVAIIILTGIILLYQFWI